MPVPFFLPELTSGLYRLDVEVTGDLHDLCFEHRTPPGSPGAGVLIDRIFMTGFDAKPLHPITPGASYRFVCVIPEDANGDPRITKTTFLEPVLGVLLGLPEDAPEGVGVSLGWAIPGADLIMISPLEPHVFGDIVEKADPGALGVLNQALYVLFNSLLGDPATAAEVRRRFPKIVEGMIAPIDGSDIDEDEPALVDAEAVGEA